MLSLFGRCVRSALSRIILLGLAIVRPHTPWPTILADVTGRSSLLRPRGHKSVGESFIGCACTAQRCPYKIQKKPRKPEKSCERLVWRPLIKMVHALARSEAVSSTVGWFGAGLVTKGAFMRRHMLGCAVAAGSDWLVDQTSKRRLLTFGFASARRYNSRSLTFTLTLCAPSSHPPLTPHTSSQTRNLTTAELYAGEV